MFQISVSNLRHAPVIEILIIIIAIIIIAIIIYRPSNHNNRMCNIFVF